MKKILPVLLLGLCSTIASAQTWVEERTDIKLETSTPRLDGWISAKISDGVGTFLWFQIDQNYAEGYVGPSFSPKPWLQFGAGVEQSQHPLRLASFAWAGGKQVQILFIGEGLGSGWWYKVEFNWNTTKNLGLGLITERYKGTGPRIQYAVPHTSLTIWSAGLFQREGSRGLIGIRLKM